MKVKYVLLASLLMLSAASFAQKDELKTLRKLTDKETLSSDDIIKYKHFFESGAKVVKTEAIKRPGETPNYLDTSLKRSRYTFNL